MCFLACGICLKELSQRVHWYGVGRFLGMVAKMVLTTGLRVHGASVALVVVGCVDGGGVECLALRASNIC